MIQIVLKFFKKDLGMDSFSINSFDAFKFYLQNLDILKRLKEGNDRET